MKKKKTIIVAGIVFLAVLFCGAVYFLGVFRSTPVLMSSQVPEKYSLNVTSSNFRQGPNQCGPYAAAMFLNRFKPTDDVPPERFVEELPWKLPGGYTHPRALESLIRKQGIQVQSYDAAALSNEEKIQFLHQQISFGFPVILLTYMYGYQHYITLLGYDAAKEELFVYDPVFTRGDVDMTVDENGELPGNRNISNTQLLSDWSNGGIVGFYSWYLLTTAK